MAAKPKVVTPPAPEPKPVDPLETAILSARAIVGGALRQLIAGQVPETDPNRLALENVFEAVRAEIAAHAFTRATLEAAANAVAVTVTVLANNSRTKQDALAVLRGEAKHLERLTAETLKV